MRYLSEEWKKAQYEGHLDPDPSKWSGCSGFDGPCGGCDSCVAAQVSYGIGKEEERCRTFQRAGFQVSDPSLIQLPYFPGFGGYHDAYNCGRAGELGSTTFRYPWEPKLV